MTLPVRLRPETPADAPFMLRLYASTRERELANARWTLEQKAAFAQSQFELQRVHYRTYFAQASFDVVLWEEEKVGRLYVYREGSEILIVDLAILPEWRGRGIGTVLLSGLISEADASGRPVSLHVESENRARTLYERLGFEPRDEKGPYLLLVRPPGKAGNNPAEEPL